MSLMLDVHYFQSQQEAIDCFKEVKPNMDFSKLFSVPNYLTEEVMYLIMLASCQSRNCHLCG